MTETSIAAQLDHAAAAYQAQFGAPPDACAFAPGRVNLLGEHTDYNGGHVLPMALPRMGVCVALGAGAAPGRVELISDTLQKRDARSIGETRAGRWSDYPLGCLKALAAAQIEQAGLRMALSTSLPMGAGLSSSAALEVATLRAAAQHFGQSRSAVEIALTARAVENEFVGMPCGIMDQFTCSVGEPGTAILLDTHSLRFAPVPSPAGFSFVIVHSGVSHQLVDDGYAQRVAQCQAAGAALGVEMLCALGEDDLDRIARLPEPLNRRARHVVTDSLRAQQGAAALKSGDVAAFGRLMTASHASQRDDYAITVAQTDALVEAALRHGALGARQTGGGFGGAVVALLRDGDVEDWCDAVLPTQDGARRLATT